MEQSSDKLQQYILFLTLKNEYTELYEFYEHQIEENVTVFLNSNTHDSDFINEQYTQSIEKIITEFIKANEYIKLDMYNDVDNEELKYTVENILFNSTSHTVESYNEENIHGYSIDAYAKLQEYQEEIINYVVESIGNVYIEAPTGFGETFMIEQIIERLAIESFLFFSPRIKINDNVKELFEKYKNSYVICYQEYEHLEEYESVDLIIYDEAHYMKDDEIDSNFEPNIERIYLSATPEEIIPNNVVEPFWNFLQIGNLMEDGILANIQILFESYDSMLDLFSIDDENINALKYQDEETWFDTNHMINNVEFNEGLIYFNTQELCEMFNKHFTSINAEHFIYTSNENETNNVDNLQLFQDEKEESLLISCEEVDMGFDYEEIDMICFGSEEQSQTDIEQMIGRGLRQFNNKTLEILLPIFEEDIDKEHYDCIESFLLFLCDNELDDYIQHIEYDDNTIMLKEFTNKYVEIYERLGNQENAIEIVEEQIEEYGIETVDDYLLESLKCDLLEPEFLREIYDFHVDEYLA